MEDAVLNAVTTGVYVLTAHHQGTVNGTSVAWVTPVSYEPTLIMVSLANVRVSHDLVNKSGNFGLNVLGPDQIELAKHFGFNTARDKDKLADIRYSSSKTGIPVLDGACAYIECRVVNSYPAGEHTMFIGEVTEARIIREDVQPLVFQQDDFF
jgi:flavin reductase (DIM6/NTAB) family NADH-FMN oxidoreductase RutF